MKQTHFGLLVILFLMLAVTWTMGSHKKAQSSRSMASAASDFLNSLSPEQKAKTSFSFDDEEARLNWHFIPRDRKGVSIKELDGAQRALAHGFLSTGLSQRGYLKATTVMSLEAILKELEQGSGPVRDPELYFFSVFGEPSESKTWGWRVEGHHLSLNFTVVKGQMVATAPTFYGSNPGEVKSGPRKGLRALRLEEDLARELVTALDSKQRTAAVVSNEAPKDILTGSSRKVDPMQPTGIPAKGLNSKQSALLMSLIEEYAHNLPEDLAKEELEKLHKAGVDKIHFAWRGGLERGQPHYYSVQGPTFLIEYDNTQNNANHIHAVWRAFDRDFGLDLLKLHYQRDHKGGANH